jgi:single-stranded-DNA-specific exonuclease
VVNTASFRNSRWTDPALAATAFLNVTRSLTGRAWADRLDPQAQREALAIGQVHGLRDSLARVLAGRGIRTDDVQRFLEPTLRDLMPDPAVMLDMGKAVARLAKAIERRERVAIFGDYDVDGATSAAQLALYLSALGADPRIHIPDRITEGYGPNSDAIRMLAEEGAKLLVTVDCGISSHEPLAEAARCGMDAIVLDHHLAGDTLPEAIALVNPNRQDDLSGLGKLAACGVVFMTLVALNRYLREAGMLPKANAPDLMGYLDIVALGTVADVVPLTGLNRAFVRQGLKVMRQRGRAGLAALMDAAGLKEPPEAYHLGFLLGPRINAGGRIGDAALGAHLLVTDDPVKAARIASDLDRLNRERQTLEQLMLAEAEAMVHAEQSLQGERAVVVVGSHDWHPGVVGLVASRLKDRFQRPAIAIAWDRDKGQGTGSARSLQGVDIGRTVKAAAEAGLIIKGGGHAMAAGLTVTESALPAMRDFLDERLGSDIGTARQSQSLPVDAAIMAGGLTMDLAADVARAGPFGQGNPEPVFALPAQTLLDVTPAGTSHLRLRFRSGDGATAGGIAFRAQGQPLGDALQASRGKTVHLLGSLQVDRWGGRERVDLRVIDVAKTP